MVSSQFFPVPSPWITVSAVRSPIAKQCSALVSVVCNVPTLRLSHGLEQYANLQQFAEAWWRLAQVDESKARVESMLKHCIEGQERRKSKRRRTMEPEQGGMDEVWEDILGVMNTLIEAKKELIFMKEELRDNIHNLYRTIRQLRLGPNSPKSTTFNDRFGGSDQIMEILETSPHSEFYYVRFATTDSSAQERLWCPAAWVIERAPQLVSNFHKSFPWMPGVKQFGPSGLIYAKLAPARRTKFATK